MSVLQSVRKLQALLHGHLLHGDLLTEFDVFVHKVRGLSSMLAAGKETQVKTAWN